MTTIHTTQAQKLAAKYASNLADRMLLTITIVSWSAKLITLGVAVVSYRHQLTTLQGWHAPVEMAYALPALFDVLTIICVLALSTPGILPSARRIAGWVITVPILLSAAINFAGHGPWMVKAAALSMPVLIPLAELVGSHLRPDFAEMDRIERAAYATAQPPQQVAPKPANRRCGKGCTCGKHNRKAKAQQQIDNAALFSRIAVELDEDYVDGVAPSSAIPVDA